MPQGISKSEYLKGKQCPLALWFFRYRKDLRIPFDPETQKNLDFGTSIGKAAQMLFPSGQLVDAPPWNTKVAQAHTKKLVRSGVQTIFEACAEHPIDKTHARIDVLTRKGRNTWQLHEVKASTRVRSYHLDDLAFQWYVFRAAGYRLESAHIIHVNPEITITDTTTLSKGNFISVDVSEAVSQRQKATLRLSFELGVLLRKTTPPECPPGPHCVNPFPCEFRHVCWQKISQQERTDIEATRTNPA